jgi:hypothetical protein
MTSWGGPKGSVLIKLRLQEALIVADPAKAQLRHFLTIQKAVGRALDTMDFKNLKEQPLDGTKKQKGRKA